MIEVLIIISQSWPIAIMFLGLLIASLGLYIIRWWKKVDADDKAYRASQALVVRERHRDD